MSTNPKRGQHGGRRSLPPNSANLSSRPHANLQPDMQTANRALQRVQDAHQQLQQAHDLSSGSFAQLRPISPEASSHNPPARQTVNASPTHGTAIGQPRTHVGSRTQGSLPPQFFIVRENGARVPLIAVDELPPNIQIEGINRTLTLQDLKNMPGLQMINYEPYGIVPYRHRAHGVRDIDGRSGPRGIGRGRAREQQDQRDRVNQSEQARYSGPLVPIRQPLPLPPPRDVPTFTGPQGRRGSMTMNPQASNFEPAYHGSPNRIELQHAGSANYSRYASPAGPMGLYFGPPNIDPTTGSPYGARELFGIGRSEEQIQPGADFVLPQPQHLVYGGPAQVPRQPEHVPYWNTAAWGPMPEGPNPEER